MELKPGYKQTAVGVIPEEWEVKSLSWVAEIRGGIAKNSNVAASDPISVYYLRVANVQDGFIDLDDMSKIELSRHDLRRYSVLPGDVLMNEGGDLDKLGRGAIWRGEINPCVHQNHVFVVRCRSALLPDYLNVWTATRPARNFFLLAGKQTTNLASISKSSLGELPVAIPSLFEQRAIAEALSDVDGLLGGLDRLIAKKRDLKQAATQQLLTGQTRLLGGWEAKTGYKQTEVGMIPEDWEIKTLGAVLSKARLGGNYPNQVRESEYPLMKMGNIARGYFEMSKVEYVTPGVKLDPMHQLIAGDILFNTRNTLDLVGKVAIWRDELPVAYYNSNLMRLEFNPNEICSNEYANYALNTEGAVTRLRGLATGTTSVAAIYTRDLMGLPFIVPPKPEQTAIAAALSDMDAEIAALERRRKKTRALKQAMMEELLTGRTRLV